MKASRKYGRPAAPPLVLFASILSLVLTACRAEATSGPAPLPPPPSLPPTRGEEGGTPPLTAAATAVSIPPTAAPATTVAASPPAWLDIPLTDVRTGETFKLSDFAGRAVILETMAVWCPLCTEQQGQIRAALGQLGDKVVAVSVDVDPGEDAETLKAYVNSKGLKWPFTIAPPELSQALVSDYGPGILSPPSTPVILIDPAGIPHKTPGGIKPAQTLVDLVNEVNP